MAPRPKNPPLSLRDRFRLLAAFAALFGNLFFALLTAKLVSKNKRPKSFRRLLGYTVIRNMISWNTSKTEQYLAPDSETAYLQYCKSASVQPTTETLPDGTKAYWVGSPKAHTVLLYFHGGGYNLPADRHHFTMLSGFVRSLSPRSRRDSAHGDGGGSGEGGSSGDGSETDGSGERLAALLLHYDTAPYASYPRQLAQAAALLNHALRALNRAPSQLILAGDSAGAALVLAVLGHILHPHPDASVPRVERWWRRDSAAAEGGDGDGAGSSSSSGSGSGTGDDSGGEKHKLKGALLICPWIFFETSSPSSSSSLQRNLPLDFLRPVALQRWSALFLAGQASDAYSEPGTVPQGWWEGLGGVVRDVGVVVGADDVLVDGQVAFGERLRDEWEGEGKGRGKCEMLVVRDEAHVSCWMDFLLGFRKEEIKMYGVVEGWLKERV